MRVLRLACGSPDLVPYVEVKRFNLRPSPRGFPKKRETRFDARIVSEAPHRNDSSHLLPTHMRDELLKDHRERDAMQWILGKFLSHVGSAKCVIVMG